MSELPYNVQKRIAWEEKTLPKSMALVKVNTALVCQKMLGATPESMNLTQAEAEEECTLETMFNLLGRNLMESLRDEFRKATSFIEASIYERDEALKEAWRRYEVAAHMVETHLEKEIQAIAEKESAMEWEPTETLHMEPIAKVFKTNLELGNWHRIEFREDSVAPSHSEVSYPVPINLGTERGATPDFQTIVDRGRASSRFNADLAAERKRKGKKAMTRPVVPGTIGGMVGGKVGRGAPSRQTSRRPSPYQTQSPTPVGQGAGDGGVGGSGGAGGGTGGAIGGDPDPSDSDPEDSDDGDSDPEPPLSRWSAWKGWHKRQLRKEWEAEQGGNIRRSTPGLSEKDGKGEKPDGYKGDTADNLERFLMQLEVKFRLEKLAFRNEVDKIFYAGSLMTGSAYGWFKTYRLTIDPDEAIRVTGRYTPSPKHQEWRFFVAQLRKSFGSRLHRDEAVAQWGKLQQTGKIDTFLDELERLRWITGYTGDVIKDKLKEGLSEELGRDWAKLEPKPEDIDLQIAKVRSMGHKIEDYEAKRKGKSTQEPKPHVGGGSGGSGSGGRRQEKKGRPKDGKPKSKAENDSKGKEKGEWKDRKVELEGISAELLKKRKEEGVCQKCGKPNHNWFECWTKSPVTSSSAGVKRKAAAVAEPEEQKTSKKAKGKSAASSSAAPVAASVGRIMELDEDEDLDLAPAQEWNF